MHYVRTTMQPHKIVRLNDAEYLDLLRSGVVYAEETGDEPLLPKLKADAKSATDMKGA